MYSKEMRDLINIVENTSSAKPVKPDTATRTRNELSKALTAAGIEHKKIPTMPGMNSKWSASQTLDMYAECTAKEINQIVLGLGFEKYSTGRYIRQGGYWKQENGSAGIGSEIKMRFKTYNKKPFARIEITGPKKQAPFTIPYYD